MKRVLVIAVLVSLIAAGCAKGNRDGKVNFENRVLGKVNGEKITRAEFDKRSKALQGILRTEVPYDQLSKDAQDRFKNDVFEKMVEEKLVKQESNKQGTVIDNAAVDARFALMKQNLGDRLEKSMKSQDMSETDVKKEIKQGMVVEEWMKKVLVVNDSDLHKSYTLYADSFASEQVRIRHIYIPASTEDTREAQDSAYRKAGDIRSQLVLGGNFEKLARQFSSCPSAKEGGDLGFVKRGDFFPEFDSVAFSLKLNELSPVFHTRVGFHIIKISEKKTKIPTFEELKTVLERRAQMVKLKEVVAGLKKKADILYFN